MAESRAMRARRRGTARVERELLTVESCSTGGLRSTRHAFVGGPALLAKFSLAQPACAIAVTGFMRAARKAGRIEMLVTTEVMKASEMSTHLSVGMMMSLSDSSTN